MMHNISKTFLMQNGGHARAFTLIEALVSISILLLAVVGPMSAISTSLSQIKIARDQMIAVNLAHEGVEAVRQIRGSNMLKEWSNLPGWGGIGSWRSGLNNGTYIVRLSSGAPVLSPCAGVCAGTIYKDNTTGHYYQYSGGPPGGVTPTQFRRTVTLTRTDNREIEIIATVSWVSSGGIAKSVEVVESVYALSRP